MVAAGNDSVVMEATSHGLALERTRNCRFDVGVVTTVTSEHLEFHGTRRGLSGGQGAPGRGGADRGPQRRRRQLRLLPRAGPRSRHHLRHRRRRRPARRRPGGRCDRHALSPRVAALARRGPHRAAGPLQRLERAGRPWESIEALGLDVHHAAAGARRHRRRARTNGARRRRPAVRRSSSTTRTPTDSLRKVLEVLRPLAARPADRRVRLGGGARSDQARADGPRRGRARRPRGRDRRGPAARGPARDQRGDRRRRALGRRDGTARRCGSSTTGARRSATPSAWRARATWSCLPARGTSAASFYGTEKRPWDEAGAAREALADAGWSAPMTSSELRAWRVTDPARWNAFVEGAPYHAFPQLWEWGEVRAMGGWRPVRLAIGPDRRIARLPAPSSCCAGCRCSAGTLPMCRADRSATSTTRPCADALVAALRSLGAAEKIATVRADPEARLETPYGRALLEAPWRAAPKVQPPTTRVIDLTVGEEALQAALKRKHRQYVNKAERAGVTIERFDGRDARRGHRSGAGRLQPHLSVHRRARRLRRPAAVLLRAGLVALRADRPGAPQLRACSTASGLPRSSTSRAATGRSRPTAA